MLHLALKPTELNLIFFRLSFLKFTEYKLVAMNINTSVKAKKIFGLLIIYLTIIYYFLSIFLNYTAKKVFIY